MTHISTVLKLTANDDILTTKCISLAFYPTIYMKIRMRMCLYVCVYVKGTTKNAQR